MVFLHTCMMWPKKSLSVGEKDMYEVPGNVHSSLADEISRRWEAAGY